MIAGSRSRPPLGTVVPAPVAAALARRGVTVLRAPSGFGKTVVVARWAETEAVEVRWVSAGDGDALALLADQAGAAEATARAVARALPPGPVTVVVDDLDDAPPELDDALLDLVARCDGLHLVVMTRSRRPVEIRGVVEADAVVLTSADLLLDAAAVTEMLTTREEAATPDLVEDILARSQGWPVVARAAVVHCRDGAVDWDAVAEYAQHLLAVDDELIVAATVLSMTDGLDPATAMTALGTGREETTAVLAALDRLGVLEAAEPGQPARLAPVVQTILSRTADPDAPEIRAAHARLTVLERERRRPAPALRHALGAQDWQAAAAILDEHHADIILNHAPLWDRAMRAVPPEVLANYPMVGSLARMLRQLPVPGDLAEQDPRVVYVDQVERLAEARFAGRFDDAARFAHEVSLGLPTPIDPTQGSTDVAVVRVQVAVTLFLAGDLDAAVHEVDLAIGSAHALPLLVHSALGTQAVVWALRGQGPAADAVLGRLAALPTDTGAIWDRALAWGHCARALRALDRLDLAGAEEAVERLAGAAPDEELWAVIAYAAAALACHRDPVAGLAALRAKVAAERRCPPGSLAHTLVAAAEIDLLHAAGEGTRAGRRLCLDPGPVGWLVACRQARVALALGADEEALLRATQVRVADDRPAAQVAAGAVEAVAQWRLGREEAVATLAAVVEVARENELRAGLTAVPRAELAEIAERGGIDLAGPDGLAAPFPARLEQIELTERERVVLRALGDTSSFEKIAGALFVSPNTVKTQVRSVYRKLGASSREEALTEAARVGLLED